MGLGETEHAHGRVETWLPRACDRASASAARGGLIRLRRPSARRLPADGAGQGSASLQPAMSGPRAVGPSSPAERGLAEGPLAPDIPPTLGSQVLSRVLQS